MLYEQWIHFNGKMTGYTRITDIDVHIKAPTVIFSLKLYICGKCELWEVSLQSLAVITSCYVLADR